MVKDKAITYPGIPLKDDYGILLKSALFKDMQKYSDRFIEKNRLLLAPYIKRWVPDPLHNWSRQWEYPFAYERICEHKKHKAKTSLNVLDAGSGVTFFSHYLASTLGCTVTCYDYDSSLKDIYSAINHSRDRSESGVVKFTHGDIRNLNFKDKSFDVVYTISVLEHTDNYEGIITEFKRILKDDGILIVTFDISLDGISDIAPDKADTLINLLLEHLGGTKVVAGSIADFITSSDIIRSDSFDNANQRYLLPWNYPFLIKMKIYASCLIKMKIPRIQMPRLSFFCQSFKK